MKLLLTYSFISILLLCTSCAENKYSKHPIIHPVPNSGITIEENKILHNGELFAELRFYFTAKHSEDPGESYLFSAETQHRGLAIYYKNEDELVWIFPEDGREEDVERGRFRVQGQTDGYVGWVYDVSISDDGKFVYYKTPGLFSQSSLEYSIEHKVSKLLDRDWHL